MTVLAALSTQAISPPLKWAGGKRWLVPQLLSIWHNAGRLRLVEPFVGGLSVALGLQPQKALLNDANPHLINFYQWIQRGLVVETDFRNDAEYFYAARARFNNLIAEGAMDTQEAAELFYYLNRTGYNGLCRFNRKGEFNVPFGRYKTISYMQDFLELREVLAQWKFSCLDFQQVEVEVTDLVYADPPYDVEFTSYSQNGFTWEDQVRVAEWLASLNAAIVASNQATPRIIELYASLGFNIQVINAPRRISSNGDRTPAKEILATLRLDA